MYNGNNERVKLRFHLRVFIPVLRRIIRHLCDRYKRFVLYLSHNTMKSIRHFLRKVKYLSNCNRDMLLQILFVVSIVT